MTTLLFTATEEHECAGRRCPKSNKILVGEKAVKRPPPKNSAKPLYYHEECWSAR